MKKIIIIMIILIVTALGLYIMNPETIDDYLSAKVDGITATQSTEPLDFVPIDTALFAGMLKPFPIKTYINSMPNSYLTNDDLIDQLEELLDNDPKGNFFFSLVQSYQDAIQSGELFVKTFGLADNIRSYFYTLGAIPVLKIAVVDPDPIWKLLDEAELESGFFHQIGKINGLEYRIYKISTQDDPLDVELLIAQQNGFLTITINSSLNSQKTIEIALGETKALDPMSSSKILSDLIKKYSFKNESLAYVNHQVIMDALTSANDAGQKSLLASQLQKFDELSGEISPFVDIKTPECRDELSIIATNWPKIVFGYKKLNIKDQKSNFAFSGVMESKNKTILDALKTLRGFIPNYVTNTSNTVLSIGMGLDLNNIASAITTIWTDLQSPVYLCEPLAEIQYEIAQQNPAVVGFFTGIFQGLKGIGFSIKNFDIVNENSMQIFKNMDFIFTLSAKDPKTILNSIKMLDPELMQEQVPTDGTPFKLSKIEPMPEEFDIDPKLAIKGEHVVIYNGKLGETIANVLANETIVQNGLFSAYFDYNKMIKPIIMAAEMNGEDYSQELLLLKELDMKAQFTFDITNNGIIFDSSIETIKPITTKDTTN